MRHPWKLSLALAATVALAGPAAAQTGTATTTSAGTTATGGGSISGLGSALGSSTAPTTPLGDSSLTTPTISALVGSGTTPSALNQSNILGGYYANPYYQGTNSTKTIAPGGFGAALYGTGGGTNGTGGFPQATGITINARAGNAAITTGGRTQGGFGQQAGGLQGGFGLQGNAANQSGVVIALPRQISYTATLGFKAPVATMPQVATDLRATLDRSTVLGNPRGVGLAMDGNVVVLSGSVASDDEARLVEGMVRLTPGVRDVRNELKVGPATP